MPENCESQYSCEPRLQSGARARARLGCARIRTSRNVSRIILHGSYARGDVHEGSDIDLIIIGDFPERFHIRTTAILEMTALPIEPLCYTKEEFDAMIANGNSFLQMALEEGYEI